MESKLFETIGRLFVQNQELIKLAQSQQDQLNKSKEQSNDGHGDDPLD